MTAPPGVPAAPPTPTAVPPSDGLPHTQRRARRPLTEARLERPKSGRWVGGVALGIARFVGATPTAVRTLWALSLPLSLGVTLIGYVLLWVLLPAAAVPRARGA